MKFDSFKRLRFTFIIFPLIFFILQFLLKADYKYYFTSAYDPAYAFLFNGLNLANGELGSGLAGFPGTPIQILVALAIRMGFLFREAIALTDDVLANPEYYLNVAGYGIVILNSMAILLSGMILYRHTGNLALSLAIQLIPFLSVTGLHFHSVVMCEPILVFAIQGIALQLALFCFGNNTGYGNRQVLLLSLFTAIGLTTKIILMPVFLLPLFVFKGWSDKLKYILVTIVISAILLIPAYPDWQLFVDWFRLLLFHEGIYGHGEAGIVDVSSFLQSLKDIFYGDWLFTLLFILILSYLSMGFIPGLKGHIHRKNQRIVAGIFIVVVLQLLMIGKHYLPHYMISVYSLIMIALLLSLTGFRKISILTRYNRRYDSLTVMLAGIFLIVRFLQSFHFSPGLKHPFTEAVDYVKNNVGDEQKIIVEGFSGACKEYGLYFGMAFSSRAINDFKPVLKKLYPQTYFYNMNQNRYFDWNTDISLVEILSRKQTTWLFRKSRTDTIPINLSDELLQLKKAGMIASCILEYKNPEAFDYVYKITGNTDALKKYYKEKATIRCDCESISTDGKSIVSIDGRFEFEKAYLRSPEEIHSGQYAVKLDMDNPFALDIRLKVCKNDYIKTTVWRSSRDGKGYIILTDDLTNGIYRAGSSVIRLQDEWKKISMNIRIPGSFQGDEIHMYLWYSGKDSCYFDDFEIKIFEGMQRFDTD